MGKVMGDISIEQLTPRHLGFQVGGKFATRDTNLEYNSCNVIECATDRGNSRTSV